MKKGILGKKLGMTQIFDEKGRFVAVTVVEAGPCTVLQKKTKETDGYEAIQVGFGDIREKLVNKPKKGHFAKAGVSIKRHVREFRLEDISSYAVGQEIKADIFAVGEKIDVSGVSKGKGFQGVIKRWHANRGPMSHVGVGTGKSVEIPEAIRKGIEDAKKNLVDVELLGNTVPHGRNTF